MKFSDNETTFEEVKKYIWQFNKERNWNKGEAGNPKNLATSVSLEASELLEHFQWLSLKEAGSIKNDPEKLKKISYEMADVFIYLIKFAKSMDLDLAKSISQKMVINSRRFPIKKYGKKRKK